MKVTQKIKAVGSDFTTHWKTPPQGRYMPYKEIASLSFGGAGVKFVCYCINNMMISIGNTLIGNTIGINPKALYVIYLLSILSSFPLTAIRAKMIDNTRNMKGKYRPYILSMGIPTALLGIGFIWMPYEHMTLFWKCAVVLLFNIGFQFFFNFYNDSYQSIINVLSPNSIERSDVLSIKSVFDNLSPSIANIFLPLVARWITGDNTLFDLRIYRVFYPPMLIVGFFISLLIYVNTEEKIVQAKTHAVQIKFLDALRAIAKNKYFWIISLAGWLGFLEGAFSGILGWLYNYQHACTPGQYSLIVTVAGNAALWSFLVAPFLIRKFGKKKILIASNIMNIVMIGAMLPVIRATGKSSIIWLLLLCTFLNQFMTSLSALLTPGINADIRDYQQYITGERIDGMFATVGLIGSVITLATSGVLPAIYEKAGLNETVALALGYSADNVYDVLYNQEYFVRICSVLILASVVGATLNVIPYFFYDLSETKQKGMISVLKIRAMFEDYGNHVLTDEDLIETVSIISEAKEYCDKAPIAKARKKADRAYNEKIEIAKLVCAELDKFHTDAGRRELEISKAIYYAGLNNYMSAVPITLRDAKQMPKSTAGEKAQRKNTIRLLRDIHTAQKAASKYYPNGIKEFDISVFEKLYAAEDALEKEFHQLMEAEKRAKTEKNSEELEKLKNQVQALRAKKKEIEQAIKKANNENCIYHRAAKPFLNAKRTVEQSENYAHYEEILSAYNQTVQA